MTRFLYKQCEEIIFSLGLYLMRNADMFKYKYVVLIIVMKEIWYIISELSAPKSFRNSLGRKTQNSNESFNSTV